MLRFGTARALTGMHEHGNVGSPKTIHAAYRLQKEQWQDKFFKDCAPARAVCIGTAAISAFIMSHNDTPILLEGRERVAATSIALLSRDSGFERNVASNL